MFLRIHNSFKAHALASISEIRCNWSASHLEWMWSRNVRTDYKPLKWLRLIYNSALLPQFTLMEWYSYYRLLYSLMFANEIDFWLQIYFVYTKSSSPLTKLVATEQTENSMNFDLRSVHKITLFLDTSHKLQLRIM